MAAKPNLFERAIATVAPRYALQRALANERLTLFGYDAAEPGTLRGSSGGMAKNASSESPRMAIDRIKTMWDARDLERNMPIIRCCLDRTSQYVCGTLQYQSQSTVAEYDAAAEAYWQYWCESEADITGRHNFRMLVELAFRSMLRDGDFGFNLVRNGPLLQLQCVEADRIGDPNMASSQIDESYVQGIRLNELGKPTAYDVYRRERKSNKYTLDETVPAEQFFFLSKPLRTDEYRSVSWLAPILAPSRDLYEMFSFERGAAKWAASIAGVIRSSDPMNRNPSANAGTWDGETSDGTKTQTVQGNKLLKLKPNEDVTTFDSSARPSGAFAAYIDAALRDISMGLNVPYGFFNMAQFGGATVRLEAMQLQRTFQRYQEILVSKALNPIKRAVLNNAIATRKLAPPPVGIDPFAGRWQFGAHLTADTGYDTDANLSLLQNGLKTAAAIAGEEGYDYEDLVDQLVKEATILRDKCALAGIPVEMVAQARFPEATAQIAAIQDAQTPKPGPTFDEMGDGGAKNLLDVLEKAAQGILPREQAIAFLVSVYELDPAVAEAMVPEKQAEAVKANQPAAPAGSKPGGEGEKKPAKEKKEFETAAPAPTPVHLTVEIQQTQAPKTFSVTRDPVTGKITGGGLVTMPPKVTGMTRGGDGKINVVEMTPSEPS